MRRIPMHILLSTVSVSLAFIGSIPASPQVMGGMMSGKGMTGRNSSDKGQNLRSMQTMMQETHGMMEQMRRRMEGNSMMVHQGMPMTGKEGSGNNWPDMMQSMNAMGMNKQQMLAKMGTVTSNNNLMANPKVSSNLKEMQRYMKSTMNSLHAMLQCMRQTRVAQLTPQ